ncbi:MAG: DUF4332 domain-containing protein, partial [Clostridiales bacterium]|nr:DUF4332 domain-containing protein [Clostridiales bacterium]
MIKIDAKVTVLRGVDEAALKRLVEQRITTVMELRQKTCTPADRELLSKQTGIAYDSIYIWAKQADLMRVKDIDADSSELLVKSGIRNVADLAAADTKAMKEQVDATFKNAGRGAFKQTIAIESLEVWQKEASGLKTELVNDPDDKQLDLLFAAAL